MNNIVLTFLMCYKTPERSDGLTIYDLLPNVAGSFLPEDQEKVEVLIKIDSDDIKACNLFLKDNYHNRFKFNVRFFITEKGEGRWAFNYHYMHLFSQRNPTSKYIGFLTDDVIINSKMKYMFKEINDNYNDLDYIVFFDSPYIQQLKHSTPFIKNLKQIVDYPNQANLWCTNFLTESYPIVTSKLFEIIGNIGWQVNIDSTLALLNVILYDEYKINIARVLGTKWFQRKDNPRAEKYHEYTFNKNLRIDSSTDIVNDYLIELTKQQAKNIYLNMKEDGVLDKYIVKES